jgi:hypothetical protein
MAGEWQSVVWSEEIDAVVASENDRVALTQIVQNNTAQVARAQGSMGHLKIVFEENPCP